jgi:hypothetical protein
MNLGELCTFGIKYECLAPIPEECQLHGRIQVQECGCECGYEAYLSEWVFDDGGLGLTGHAKLLPDGGVSQPNRESAEGRDGSIEAQLYAPTRERA